MTLWLLTVATLTTIPHLYGHIVVRGEEQEPPDVSLVPYTTCISTVLQTIVAVTKFLPTLGAVDSRHFPIITEQIAVERERVISRGRVANAWIIDAF
jgi:hypothetical protein